MPFNVEPVIAPAETRIDWSKATEDDRLLIEFENGQKMVFRIAPPPSRVNLVCDLDRSSNELVEEICLFILLKWSPGIRFWAKKPTIRDVRKGLSASLFGKRPKVTVGQHLNVDAKFGDLTDYGWVAGNSVVKSITSYVSVKIQIVE